MKRVCFILASSDDRSHHLKRCVECVRETKYKDSDFFLYYQGKQEIPYAEFFAGVEMDDNLRGVFTPRYQLMKKYSKDYEYTIIIDDDLFMYKYTSYENAMSFMDRNENIGAISLGRNVDRVRPEIRQIRYKNEDFNVNGGLVLPWRAVKEILNYYEDKERDYTEDIFWLLIYCKGYDLYRDFSSNANHVANRKTRDGKISGFRKMRYEKPRIPMLPEYVNERFEYSDLHKKELYLIPEVRDVNQKGMEERIKCRRRMGFQC